MSTNKVTIKANYEISNISQMTDMAKVLRQHIIANKLYTNIQGKNYVEVEGWQFAGGLLGLFPRVESIENISNGNEIKWKAEVVIVNLATQQIVSRGFAVCSKAESKKKTYDEYAVLSMAQTRAIGKAYRNVIGWTMKLAGYEGTPSEEMKTDASEPVKAAKSPEAKGPAEPIYCQGARKGGCPDGAEITKAGSDFSMKVYGKQLCRNCARASKPIKK